MQTQRHITSEHEYCVSICQDAQDAPGKSGHFLQASHAVLAMSRDAAAAGDDLYNKYVAETEGQMNQLTVGVKSEAELQKVMKRMDEQGLRYAPWTEMPENTLVGFASWPNRRRVLQKAIKGLRFF